jgi:hypothetical protein
MYNDMTYIKKFNFNQWRVEGLKEENGVLIGSDECLEWLLPWWWENYSRFNSFPVAFADFGMSEEMRAWCQERGELIDLTFPDMYGASNALFSLFMLEQMDDDAFLQSRNAWFKKPLACLQTPFKRTIWIDMDCEVRGKLGELFAIGEQHLALTQDACSSYSTTYPIYNSGVFAFPRELPVIQEWAELAIEHNYMFLGDQDLLSWIIDQKKLEVAMPKIFNWSRLWEPNPEAVVLHWHGPEGKEQISKMIASAE